MKNPNYDAFIFDLGRVLVDFDHHISARKIATLVHQSASAPERRITEEWLYQLFFESDIINAFDEGKVSPRKFYSEMKKLTGIKISYSEFVPLWADIFSEKKEMAELVSCLKKDYRLVLMSNVNVLQFERIRKNFSVVSEFDELVLSYEVGAMKPDPKIYEAAIKATNTAPDRIIYTDDRQELIDGGIKAGIKASFVFTDLEQFKSDLKSIGVKINDNICHCEERSDEAISLLK